MSGACIAQVVCPQSSEQGHQWCFHVLFLSGHCSCRLLMIPVLVQSHIQSQLLPAASGAERPSCSKCHAAENKTLQGQRPACRKPEPKAVGDSTRCFMFRDPHFLTEVLPTGPTTWWSTTPYLMELAAQTWIGVVPVLHRAQLVAQSMSARTGCQQPSCEQMAKVVSSST